MTKLEHDLMRIVKNDSLPNRTTTAALVEFALAAEVYLSMYPPTSDVEPLVSKNLTDARFALGVASLQDRRRA